MPWEKIRITLILVGLAGVVVPAIAVYALKVPRRNLVLYGIIATAAVTVALVTTFTS